MSQARPEGAGSASAGKYRNPVPDCAPLSVPFLVRQGLLGPVTITRDTIFHGIVTGDVTVLGGVHLDLLGTVLGNLLVEDSGTACVRGVVAEAVINRGGVVEIYGSVGSITGTERTQIHPGSTVES